LCYEGRMAWSKKSGHWKWEEPVASTGEFLESRPAAETGDYWGKWVYNLDLQTLCFASPSRHVSSSHPAVNYEVRLDEIKTAADLVRWLVALRSKGWMAASDFGDFLDAVDDLVGLDALAFPSE
jgi:hypothetical protein